MPIGREVVERTKNEAAQPLYERVHHGLHRMIEQGVLPTGLVLLEGPIAAYFGVSRIPVRRALGDLAEVGVIRKFRGRGYLVDPDRADPTPLRLEFRSLDLPDRPSSARGGERRYIWQRVYDEIADVVARCLLFGTYRISETGICERYGISRTVVREVLGRLMARGLIDKDSRSHWICGPFTARANNEQYGMRMILEPAALRDAVSTGRLADIRPMLARLESARSLGSALSVRKLTVLEQDLHGLLLEACPNFRLKATITQNQLPLSINRTFYAHFGVAADEPMIEEHHKILAALSDGRVSEASDALAAHLNAARERSQARLKVLAVIDEPGLPDFLERMH
jgi:DNA-binding GntR family transcriptional regulator